jgi:HEAT repeat protein
MSRKQISAKRQLAGLLGTIAMVLGTMVILLTLIGGPKEQQLVKELTVKLDDPEEDVRAAALQALGKIGDERAAAAIMKAIDRNDSLLELAVASLKKIGVKPDYRTPEAKGNLQPRLTDNIKRAVQKFVRNDPAVARLAEILVAVILAIPVFWLLHKLERAFQPFEKLARVFGAGKSSAWVARISNYGLYILLLSMLLFSVFRISRYLVEEPLVAEDIDIVALQKAKITLAGMFKDKAAVGMLRQILADVQSSPEIRWRAAYALGQIGVPIPREELLAALTDGDKRVRQFSTWALGNIFAKPGEARSETEPLVRKFCQFCGGRLDEHGTYCPRCGAKVSIPFARDEDQKVSNNESAPTPP